MRDKMLPHVVVTIAEMQVPGLVPNCYVSAKHVPLLRVSVVIAHIAKVSNVIAKGFALASSAYRPTNILIANSVEATRCRWCAICRVLI